MNLQRMFLLSCLLFCVWLCQAKPSQNRSSNVINQARNKTNVAQLSTLLAQSSEIQESIAEKEEKTNADMQKQGDAKLAKLGLLGFGGEVHGMHSLLPLLLLSGHHGKLNPLLLLLLSGKLGVGHNSLVQLLLFQHLGIGKNFHGFHGLSGLGLGKLGLLGGLSGLGLGGINPLVLLLLANDLKKTDDKFDLDGKHGRVFPDYAELPPIKYPAYFDPAPKNKNYVFALDQYPVEANLIASPAKELIHAAPYDWMSATPLNEAAPSFQPTLSQPAAKTQSITGQIKKPMLNKQYEPAPKQEIATYNWPS